MAQGPGGLQVTGSDPAEKLRTVCEIQLLCSRLIFKWTALYSLQIMPYTSTWPLAEERLLAPIYSNPGDARGFYTDTAPFYVRDLTCEDLGVLEEAPGG